MQRIGNPSSPPLRHDKETLQQFVTNHSQPHGFAFLLAYQDQGVGRAKKLRPSCSLGLIRKRVLVGRENVSKAS
jgi:hypothetical protein